MKVITTLASCFFLINIAIAIAKPKNLKNHNSLPSGPEVTKSLLKKFSKNYKNNADLKKLKNEVLKFSGKAVPALIGVMKSKKYPDKSRWLATFLLGRIVGQKSVPFIAKFTKHPNWIMRMASLKTLLALNEKKYAGVYVDSLKDDSFIVRTQALNNIRKLKLTNLSPHVWAMLYDKRNYYEGNKKGKDNKTKGTNLIKTVIKTIGDFKFAKAKVPLLKMINKDKYDNIFAELDYSLQSITGKQSPRGPKKIKKHFWHRIALSEVTI